MGGAACLIIIRSVVRFDAVPTQPHQQAELADQLRKCYYNPTIAAAVEAADQYDVVCAILAKPDPMSVADMTTLMGTLDGVYGST